MANSLSGPIQDALLTLWRAAAAEAGTLEGVSVSDHWQEEEPAQQLAVGAARTVREFAGMGTPTVPHYETVTVNCEAGVVSDGKQAARDRLWEILEAAEDIIREANAPNQHPPLGVDGVMWARVSQIDSGLTRTDNSPVAEAAFVVEVRTRIYP